jgi:hypothetical protein
MDPVSIFALVTASFNGIKKAVELGREVEDVYAQLSKWAGAVSDLREFISQQENRKPSIFEKIGFSKNETAEAFDMMIAKQKLYEMEREIHLMFIYGELQHLGIEGYKEFVVLRKEIKEKREELIYDQMRRRKIFIEKVRDYTVVGISLIFCSFVVIWLLQLMLIAGTE